MADSVPAFYDDMAPLYHLIFQDWDRAIDRQASMLDTIIRERWGSDVPTILDVSCGIGTQSLGLAKLGYEVIASDISPGAVERARQEAQDRGLSVDFSVADMRSAFGHHGQKSDVVLSCDNSVPHLLTDEAILAAFQQFYACTAPGGGCLISVRDYEKEDRSETLKTYGKREEGDTTYIIFQTRTYRGDHYEVSMYFVADDGGPECTTHIMRSRYYAIPMGRLMDLLREGGFTAVERVDGSFVQPVIIGTRT